MKNYALRQGSTACYTTTMSDTQTFDDNYNILNPDQKKAVDTTEGPVFVMAGPGTGKTQVLTLRIANILKQTPGVEPENILALTFTNTAAHNMRERLVKMIGAETAYRIHISTFHSFAEDMIHTHNEFFPRMMTSRLASAIERIKILEDVLENMEATFFSVFKRRSSTMRALLSSIDTIKNEGLTPEEFIERSKEAFDASMDDEDLFYKRAYKGFKAGDMKPAELAKRERYRDKQHELASIYTAYQEQLVKSEVYDYADLIITFIHGMREHEEFRNEIQERFQYILVDEHQDTNDAQNTIIHELIDNPIHEGKPNVFVVGDDKQAIFRFAGASVSSFTELQQKVAHMDIIELGHNYRSGQHVLDSAHGLITQSDDHAKARELKAYFSDYTGVLEYRPFSEYKKEVVWVVHDIKQRIESGEDPDDMAVLYRNNKDGYDTQHLLGTLGIDYQDRSKKNILEDPDMITLLLLFQAVHDIDADEIVARVLYIDFLGIDVLTTQSIFRQRKFAKRADKKYIISIISDPDQRKELGISQDQQAQLEKLSNLLQQAVQKKENESCMDFFTWFVRESGYLGYVVGHENAVYALAKLERLYDEVRKEQSARGEFIFDDFIHYINSLKKYDIKLDVTSTGKSGVHLMTYHGAKGLEFDTVYIIKALEKRKQSSEIKLPFDDFQHGHQDDERRLFYVALTRARKNILISSHRVGPDGKEKSPSRFIEELEIIEHKDTQKYEKEQDTAFAQFFHEEEASLSQLTDVDYVIEKFKKTKLSVSALNNYMDDPVLYFFRNLLHLPEAKTPHLIFGNLVHETLEYFFKQAIEQQSIPNGEELQKILGRVTAQHPEYRPYKTRAEEFVVPYVQHYQKDFTIPIDTELRIPAIPFSVNEQVEILLTGVVDKISRDDGEIVVWDYKTGKSYSDMDKARRDKLHRQAVFYKYLLMHYKDGLYSPTRVVFDFIQPSEKTGTYEQHSIEPTTEDVEELTREIKELAQHVLGGTLLEYAPTPTDRNKEYIELLRMIRSRSSQQSLF